jgi:AhpD family alkylhydroperoxidase
MDPRINYAEVSPEGVAGVRAMERYLATTSLEPALRELVKLRASQINGCAYCIDMHTKVARHHGETEQRLYGVTAWHETPFYSDRERAALAWTEAVTLISQNDVPDELYEATRHHFSEQEIVDLTLAIAAINTWNRLAISFRSVPGSFRIPEPRASK